MPVIRSAEIITVGTELLLGEIVDTNSSRLAQHLARLGVNVYWSQKVGDNSGRLEQALTSALGRTDLIILTGGLGPTDDDLTRDALANVLGEKQRVDPELEKWLRGFFEARGAVMPDSNLRQAHVIDSATVLPNPVGTAPGWLVVKELGGAPRTIVTLPGPPRELDRMWHHEAVPRLVFPDSRLFVRTFKSLGLGESHVAQRLGKLTDQPNPSVATYAKADGVHVRVAAKGDDEDAARALARTTVEEVERILGEYVWGHDADELPALVLAQLAATDRTLAVAEGLSGGLLTSLLTERADEGSASPTRRLAGSVILTGSRSITAIGVSPTALGGSPIGSPEVVEATAEAVRSFFGADVGVAVGLVDSAAPAATTPSAGVSASPQAAGAGTPNRLALAVANGGRTTVRTMELPALGRSWLRERAAVSALNLLRLELR